MKGHYCTSCKTRLGIYYKRYMVEKKPMEKGPFYMCENKECRDYIPTPLNETIERPLNASFTWSKRVPVENVFDVV